jgi:hypothetical protein
MIRSGSRRLAGRGGSALAAEPGRLGTLVAQEGQGEVDALDLAEPAFGFSVLAPKDQVRLISSRC